MNPLTYIAPISGFVVIVIGVAFFSWVRILKETNSLLKEQNTELKAAHKDLLDKYNETIAAAASMQGQIDILKSIPLVNIDTTLKQIARFNKETASSAKVLLQSNKEILLTLQQSATVLAKDTKDAASAVKDVKSDLENGKE